MIDNQPLIDSWGGGVNSTALILGQYERGIIPDAILFADTGGEKPETYAFLETFQTWLAAHSMPPIIVVRKKSMYTSLEDNCLRKKMLPSRAYGLSSCADKYKVHPQDKWCNHWEPAKECWKSGKLVFKAIGFDAGEMHRANRAGSYPVPARKVEAPQQRSLFPLDVIAVNEPKRKKGKPKYEYIYPLIEWGWKREDCVAAIQRHGLPVPVKSACFFCPASTKQEVLWLAKHHPELFERALTMESGAENLRTVKGLGRHWTWRELVEAGLMEREFFSEVKQTACICFDGQEVSDEG